MSQVGIKISEDAYQIRVGDELSEEFLFGEEATFELDGKIYIASAELDEETGEVESCLPDGWVAVVCADAEPEEDEDGGDDDDGETVRETNGTEELPWMEYWASLKGDEKKTAGEKSKAANAASKSAENVDRKVEEFRARKADSEKAHAKAAAAHNAAADENAAAGRTELADQHRAAAAAHDAKSGYKGDARAVAKVPAYSHGMYDKSYGGGVGYDD